MSAVRAERADKNEINQRAHDVNNKFLAAMVFTTRREIAATSKFRFPRPTECGTLGIHTNTRSRHDLIPREYSNLANIWMNYTYNIESRYLAQSRVRVPFRNAFSQVQPVYSSLKCCTHNRCFSCEYSG